MYIKFTQYLMPDGKTEEVKINRPEEIGELAKQIISKGYKFEIEMLSNQMISMTCEDGVNEPIAHEICQNGPDVLAKVDKLINDAYLFLFAKAN